MKKLKKILAQNEWSGSLVENVSNAINGVSLGTAIVVGTGMAVAATNLISGASVLPSDVATAVGVSLVPAISTFLLTKLGLEKWVFEKKGLRKWAQNGLTKEELKEVN